VKTYKFEKKQILNKMEIVLYLLAGSGIGALVAFLVTKYRLSMLNQADLL
jgi:hypothetical protein